MARACGCRYVYNSLLVACVRALPTGYNLPKEAVQAAEGVLQEMASRGVPRDFASYSIAMDVYAKAGMCVSFAQHPTAAPLPSPHLVLLSPGRTHLLHSLIHHTNADRMPSLQRHMHYSMRQGLTGSFSVPLCRRLCAVTRCVLQRM